MDGLGLDWMTLLAEDNLQIARGTLNLRLTFLWSSYASSRSVEVCNIQKETFYQTVSRSSFTFLSQVILLKAGPSAGNIAVITQIIDHNQVLMLCPLLIHFPTSMYHSFRVGLDRRSNNKRPPSIVSVQTPYTHISLSYKTPSCYCRKMEQVGMGHQTQGHRTAKNIEI